MIKDVDTLTGGLTSASDVLVRKELLMTTDLISAWQTRFRKAAEADQMSLLRQHLEMLELPDEPALLLKGTLAMVPVCLAYRNMDGHDLDTFLYRQAYDPARSQNAGYVLTFDLYGQAYGRIAVDAELRECDLADMFGASWMDLHLCGYHGFYITRVDAQELTAEEVATLKELVENDLFFDYTEDELSVWFDDSRSPHYLYVDVSERDESLND